MKKLHIRARQYAGIFRGVPIPWAILALTLLVSIGESQMFLQQATLTAGIIDGTQQAVDQTKLVRFVVVTLATAAFSVATTIIGGWAYQKINLGVRNKLWNKLMRLPTRYYDGENGDTLVSRVTTDASESYVYFHVAINLVSVLYAAVASYVQMAAFSPVLSRYILLLTPIYFILAWVFGKLNFLAGQKGQTTFSKAMGYLVEMTRNLRLVKAARMEYREQERGKKLFHNQFRASIWTALSSSSTVLLSQVLTCAAMIITFVMGRSLVAKGEITIGKLLGFYTIATMLIVRFTQLLMFYGMLKAGNGRMEKIAEILSAPEEKQGGIPFDVADADITAENIGFSYGERAVLKDVSFTIPKGEITAVIGANGAGKSTVFKLLEQMYEPSSGHIRFGGTDVRDFELRSWRESFAIVSQEKPLLSGTVRDNILYGTRRRVSEEELIRVAKQANIYDFVMQTPGGFDAQVGVGGSNFSGGQCQCIAIARAMMRNPDYLLLDEATSNLDAQSERIVSQALSNLMRGRTTVMIAHNYSATREASHIVVMRDGRVEAEGSPAQLLATNEYYRSFVSKAG